MDFKINSFFLIATSGLGMELNKKHWPGMCKDQKKKL
jgi:hypothetical protein